MNDFLADLEPVSSLVESVLANGAKIVISAVTLTEVIMRPARASDERRIRDVQAAFGRYPSVAILDFDHSHAVETAFVRGEHGSKLPDAAVVATARPARAVALIGNDRHRRGKNLGVPYHHMDDLLALG